MNSLLMLRAWDPVAKKMTVGEIEHFDDMLGYRFHHFECEPEEVVYMRCTGVKSFGGQVIFESDVVSRQGKLHEIEYDDEHHMWAECYGDGVNYFTLDWMATKSLKIIGNIYENPELLENDTI